MRQPTEVFDEWAIIGKDKGMETSHEASVSEILEYALARVKTVDGKFTFLDVGCGNGWVADQLSNNENCISSVGIDGAENMIANAHKRQSSAIFYLKDFNDFDFKDKFDNVFFVDAMKFAYEQGLLRGKFMAEREIKNLKGWPGLKNKLD